MTKGHRVACLQPSQHEVYDETTQFTERRHCTRFASQLARCCRQSAATRSRRNFRLERRQVGVRGDIYGYLPSIGGKLDPCRWTGGHTDHQRHANQIINSLKMTFMGTLDAHYGRWGAFTDVLYRRRGWSKSRTHDFSVGNVPTSRPTATADLNLDLKGTDLDDWPASTG
jgi:hypothetical protein